MCYYSARSQYCLEHINIIDVKNGDVLRDQFIVIDSNRIKLISSNPVKNIKFKVYDCGGKYIIPGLWDMHIHEADDPRALSLSTGWE